MKNRAALIILILLLLSLLSACGCSHDYTHIINAVEPGCLSEGYSGDTECFDCGKIIKKGSVLPPKGHTEVTVNASEVCCNCDGYTGDIVCSICGELLQEGSIIVSTGEHTHVLRFGIHRSTLTECGKTGYLLCTDCGQVVEESADVPVLKATDFDSESCSSLLELINSFRSLNLLSELESSQSAAEEAAMIRVMEYSEDLHSKITAGTDTANEEESLRPCGLLGISALDDTKTPYKAAAEMLVSGSSPQELMEALEENFKEILLMQDWTGIAAAAVNKGDIIYAAVFVYTTVTDDDLNSKAQTSEDLRNLIVNTAISYIGTAEGSEVHRDIIDTYNSYKKDGNLRIGYRVKYQDSWCMAFVSTVFIKAKLSKLIVTECGCERAINVNRDKKNNWQEDDSYTPLPGDIIMFNWSDTGDGDCTGAANHTGIVEYVDGNTIHTIEGNSNHSVKRRTYTLDGIFIRGYIVPDYESLVN